MQAIYPRWDGVGMFGNGGRHSQGQWFGVVGDRGGALSLSVMRIDWVEAARFPVLVVVTGGHW